MVGQKQHLDRHLRPHLVHHSWEGLAPGAAGIGTSAVGFVRMALEGDSRHTSEVSVAGIALSP